MVKFIVSFLLSFPQTSFSTYTELRELKVAEDVHLRLMKPEYQRKIIRNISYKVPGAKPIDFKISVSCWKDMAKVYIKNMEQSFETVNFKNNIWVAFSIKHIIKELEVKQLEIMHSKKIEFSFDGENKRLLPKAASDSLGYYYGLPFSTEIQFRPIFPERVSKPSSAITQSSTLKKNEKSLNYEVFPEPPACIKPYTSWGIPAELFRLWREVHPSEDKILQRLAEIHLHKIQKIMEKHSPQLSDDIPSRISTRKTKAEKKNVPNEILSLNLENLFFDESVWTLSTGNASLSICLSMFSLMDRSAKDLLNPIGIQIHSLYNLPQNEDHKYMLSQIYLEYELKPVIPITKSNVVNIKNLSKVRIAWTKSFFSGKITPIEWTNCLQTKKLLIRIFGNWSMIRENLSRHLYKDHSQDSRFSKTRKSEHKEPQNKDSKPEWRLMGVARVDLSTLTFGGCCVMELASVHSNYELSAQKPNNDYFNHFNCHEVHLDKAKQEEGVVINSSLANTFLKVTVKIAVPRRVCTVQLLNSGTTYSKVLAFIKDGCFAEKVLEALLEHNNRTLLKPDYILPFVPYRKLLKLYEDNGDCIKYYSSGRRSFSKASACVTDVLGPNFFSGFYIDCLSCCIIMAESMSYVFPRLLEELMKMPPNEGKILFNSDLIFTERHYEILKNLGGIYCIRMKKLLSEILLEYNSKHNPIPASAEKMLLKLPKLLNSKSLVPIIQDRILPTIDELISFDTVFGIPQCANMKLYSSN